MCKFFSFLFFSPFLLVVSTSAFSSFLQYNKWWFYVLFHKGGSDDDESEGDDGEAAEADEDESDLDLSWKLLDIARAIVEKSPEDTMEKVNIWAALGEVSMERGLSFLCSASQAIIITCILSLFTLMWPPEDIEASLNDYKKALSILERLVEPDHRRIVELYPYHVTYQTCVVTFRLF